MIKSLQDLKEVLGRPEKKMTAAEAVQAFRLFRQLEEQATDPAEKERFRVNKHRFRGLARMKSDTRRMSQPA
jgi:hypothetical protein